MNNEIKILKKEIKDLANKYLKICPKYERLKVISIKVMLFSCNDVHSLKGIKHKFELLLKRNSQVS